MLCYTGVSFSRIYLNKKSKRAAWRAYMRVNDWWYDFEGLRYAYKTLFSRWDDPDCWQEEDAFFDDHY